MTDDILREQNQKLDTIIILLARLAKNEELAPVDAVAELKNLGLTNDQIAIALGVSKKTVANNVTDARKQGKLSG